MWFSLVSFRASIVVAASIDIYTIFFFFIRPRYIIIDVPASWSGVFCCESLHHHFQVARTYTLRQKAYPRISNGESLSFFHARGKEEQRSHETVSKAADTGRGGGSRALVAWLDRHAALPRDTLLKQRTTLKFSESTGSVCKGNKSWDARDRNMPRDFKLLWDRLENILKQRHW